MPTPTYSVAELDWPAFLAALDWRQGEHVSLVGPTGTGKTTAAVQLLHLRRFVAAIGTKPRDDTLEYLRGIGYRDAHDLPHEGKPPRVIVWPKYRTLDRSAKKVQADHVRRVFDQAYTAGSWCLFIDEAAYAAKSLRLRPELEDLWDQGRAVDVSVIACTQRPRHVPVQMYSAATHLFLWSTNDAYDVARLGELNGADTKAVRAIVPKLDRHEVLYVNTRDRSMCVTVAPPLTP